MLTAACRFAINLKYNLWLRRGEDSNDAAIDVFSQHRR